MTNSKTTLMELTRQYRSVLKKCFLLNLGIILFAASAANAKSYSMGNAGDLYKILNGKDNDLEVLTLYGNVKQTLNNPTFYVTDPTKIAYVNFMFQYPKEKWFSGNVGTLTPAQGLA